MKHISDAFLFHKIDLMQVLELLKANRRWSIDLQKSSISTEIVFTPIVQCLSLKSSN